MKKFLRSLFVLVMLFAVNISVVQGITIIVGYLTNLRFLPNVKGRNVKLIKSNKIYV